MRILTTKDYNVKDYLIGLGGAASRKHLQHLIKSNSRCIHRLVEHKIVTEEKGIIQISGHNVSDSILRGRLMTLDVLDALHSNGKITSEINVADDPIHFMAKSVRTKQYVNFSFIEKGKEFTRCQMIDNNNHGNIIVILESTDQMSKLNLKTKVSDIYYYTDFV